MKIESAVIVTDAVNLQQSQLVLSGIVQSMETPLAVAADQDMPYGMPVNIAHDQCRPIGWSVPRGVYLAKDMARQFSLILSPEGVEDRAAINARLRRFAEVTQRLQVEPYRHELEARIAGLASDKATLLYSGAAAVVEASLAANIFPEFFAIGGTHVDKHGLVDLAFLKSRTRELQPGIFHETERDVLLFAHPFFRRSLSRRNSLNAYVLASFAEAAALAGVTARLRLDPDMIGHPASARGVIELEYWNGPNYSDDIAAIPSGVAEHKSEARDRVYSGVDKTQIWWKDPETRADSTSGAEMIRTFEIEELIEDESPGLQSGHYGCRYAHAEYDIGAETISHFDGAIRAYAGETYLKRIEERIDRAGKQANYRKLFRLDGALPIAMWKRVLTDWYRRNRLIPEYLGAPSDDPELSSAASFSPDTMKQRAALSAFICLEPAEMTPPDQITVGPDQSVILRDQPIAVAEIGRGAIGTLLRQWIDPATTTAIAAKDSLANLSRIFLPGDPPSATSWRELAEPLAAAIAAETRTGRLARVAFAASWTKGPIDTTLSIEGDAELVSTLLGKSLDIVCPDRPASEWVEPFNEVFLKLAPDLAAPLDLPDGLARLGRLTLDRSGEATFEFSLSEQAHSAYLHSVSEEERMGGESS
ncbi:hypothetical protein [Novosphingobium sp. ZW T3_23]|uniref:hypothetical protein n=1 Tax=Novosphingobium sp. ZW T3_23 TaxID=3378084 RepID=UPI003853E41B